MTGGKPERTQITAKENCWETALLPELAEFEETGNPSDIVWMFYAKRDDEVLKIVFFGDSFRSAFYSFRDQHQDEPKTLRRCTSILTGNPDKLAQSIKQVPFEPNAPAFEILSAVIGHEITWVKSLTGLEKSALVDVNLHNPTSAAMCRIYIARSGRRILEWTDAQGFHAVSIQDIVNVR